ncbi:MAG: hypothetical protein ACLTT1_11015, partial [[Clostridium] scindens]
KVKRNLVCSLNSTSSKNSADGRAGFHCEDFSMIKWQEARMKKRPPGLAGFLDSRPVIAEMVATVDMIRDCRATGCKVRAICRMSAARMWLKK